MVESNYRLRSFVRRDSRKTLAQHRALQIYLPQHALNPHGLINLEQVFMSPGPCFMEIGFGSGQALLEMARQQPGSNFIGVETYRPGIGSLLLGLERYKLDNVKIFYGDAYDLLEQSVPDDCLDGMQIFFPDPWPKRRHHVRRLIQPAFISLITEKLKLEAHLHLATDWEDYAVQMLKILQDQALLRNQFDHFASRSSFRPIITKFERRAICDGRRIWDLQFAKG